MHCSHHFIWPRASTPHTRIYQFCSDHLSSTSTMKPQFFRVMHPSFLTHGCLGFPQAFLKEHGGSLSDFVFLHLPFGPVWRVELLKRHGEVLLGSGWQRFAHFCSIEHGHVLQFRYEGDSHFHVLVFDRTACEIEEPCDTPPTHDHGPKVSPEILDGFPPCRAKTQVGGMIDTVPNEDEIESELARGKDSLKSPQACSSHPYHSSIPGCSDGAMPRAKAFKPRNPCFLIVMKPSYVNGHNLSVPSPFAKRHLHPDSTNVTISVSDGRAWPIKYIVANRGQHACFSSGWKRFAQDNCLKIGDVCSFELIKCAQTSVLFKVVIFRKGKDESIPTSIES